MYIAQKIVPTEKTLGRIGMTIKANLKRCMAKMLCTLVIFCQGIYFKLFCNFLLTRYFTICIIVFREKNLTFKENNKKRFSTNDSEYRRT
ncbi:hypothetical protein BC6_00067 [Bacillus phage BC-6]|nr:hypothetical protein BC6_00067 [Bacillus phage BC-6]